MKTMAKENIALEVDKWGVYTMIDFTAAFILVVVCMVSADIPRHRIEIVRKAAPYVARGWVPEGPQLNLPLRVSTSPTPVATSRPEQEATTEEATTTEATTENLSENIEAAPEKEKLEKVEKVGKLEKLEEPQEAQYYVVLPQGQNIVYTIPRSAALLAVPKGDLMATQARLQAMPLSPGIASPFYTPFGASYIQIYQ